MHHIIIMYQLLSLRIHVREVVNARYRVHVHVVSVDEEVLLLQEVYTVRIHVISLDINMYTGVCTFIKPPCATSYIPVAI